MYASGFMPLGALTRRSRRVRANTNKMDILKRRVHVEAKLLSLGVEIPPPMPWKKGTSKYISAVRSGNLLFLAGHLPYKPGKYWDNEYGLIKGTVGESLNTQDGYDAGRQCAIALLSTLKAHTGDLDKVSRIVKVFGVVNCIPGFPDAPKAVNGASDLLMEAFGEKGIHARTAIGTNALPFNVAVEVELIAEVKDD
eukprot:TRINITY_DN5372_c0_g1_i2.p1 TRINITY_DN5372_c0_g1~~TRINITY_DN5372_c0_g1_i2.p1  ORF type:complete len:196 (-),score=21.01 TRINITY_DN5372_c0_g1_i2:565-1152(-)